MTSPPKRAPAEIAREILSRDVHSGIPGDANAFARFMREEAIDVPLLDKLTRRLSDPALKAVVKSSNEYRDLLAALETLSNSDGNAKSELSARGKEAIRRSPLLMDRLAAHAQYIGGMAHEQSVSPSGLDGAYINLLSNALITPNLPAEDTGNGNPDSIKQRSFDVLYENYLSRKEDTSARYAAAECYLRGVMTELFEELAESLRLTVERPDKGKH